MPEYELESYTSSLDESIEDIKEIYHQHGVCEQFHSELKTDMGIEIMPSGEFKTNELILYVAMYTYNISQIIHGNVLVTKNYQIISIFDV